MTRVTAAPPSASSCLPLQALAFPERGVRLVTPAAPGRFDANLAARLYAERLATASASPW